MADDPREPSTSHFQRSYQSVEAGRRYRAALADLDHAVEQLPYVVETLAAAQAEIARLDRSWRKYAPEPTDGPARRAVRRVLAEIARLMPWRRRALNGATVAALSRQADFSRTLVDALRHVHAHMVLYAETVAPFVNTRMQVGASADSADLVQAAVNALATDWLAKWESLAAREQRYDARMAALTRAYEELKEVAGLAHQGTASLRRTVEALAASLSPAAGPPVSGPTVAAPAALDAYQYVAFEDRFRGSRDEIRQRLSDYLPIFAGASNVVDVGCGRGELLDLFREGGIGARGIDLNDEMVEACRARGLQAERADALTWLAAQPDQSLGGLVAIQVVEHLEPPYLMRFIETARHKLKPGAPIVLETINAACWVAFFESFIRDFTHARPLHPDTLRYLVQASGFSSVDLQYRSPVDASDKLPTLRLPATNQQTEIGSTLVDLVDAVNAHAEMLNARMFTYRDFAVIGRK